MGYSRSPKAGVFETYENEEDRNKKVEKQEDKSKKEIGESTDTAAEGTRGLEQQQHGTDKEYLNENQKANYAKDGGQYGRVNNRDYGTTLRLAREADAYNNRPQAHVTSNYGIHNGGIQDMGTLMEKPKIETMETRAMDQSFNLDTNQKQLAQALQDAVNHKDLDAFQQLYKQLYGIELDRMTAEIEMTKFARQQLSLDTIRRDLDEFEAYLKRGLDAQSAATIAAIMRSDDILGAQLSAMLGGGVTLNQSEALMHDIWSRAYSDSLAQGLSPEQALLTANGLSTALGAKNANITAGIAKESGRWGNRMSDNKTGKGYYSAY